LGALRRYALKKAAASRPVAKTIDTDGLKVPVEKLRWVPDAAALPEKASAAERGQRRIVRQDRGLESLQFGLEMEDAGYNVIVTGADGTGRETAVREALSELAPKRANPGDLVAAVNFSDMSSPIILKMAAGEGAAFVQGAGEMVAGMPGALRKALSQGPVAQARKQVQAKLQANAADREKAFQREAAKVQVVGGVGIEVSAQQTDETHIGIVSALTKDGARVKPEDLDKALAGTGVTKEEVMADFQAKAKPLIEKYSEIVRTNMQEQMQAQMQLSMIEQKAVAGVVQEMVQPLAAVVSGAESREQDADHKAWRASAEAKMAAWQEKVAALRVAGAFGVAVGEGVSLTFQGKPVNQKIFEALKAKGAFDAKLTWDAVVAKALEAVKPLLEEVQALQEALEAEHKALHENDAPMSPERRAAMGWLQAFAQDLVGNYKAFTGESEADPSERYNVNLLVDNSRSKGAPVIFEHNPSFNSLFGYAEDNKKMLMLPNGAMAKKEAPGGPTLKAGSFLKANGGFLVINLMDMLREPGSYQSLMRMVRTGRAEIVEDGLVGAMSAKQGASYGVEAKVKLVLIGSPYLKALLAHNDEDFSRQFHAVAEFDNSLRIAADTVKGYLRFMREAVTSSTGKMLDFGRDAIAGVLESAAAMAESNEKLTAQFGAVY
ncbi:MAG: AAA family ATPase, partial [Elusimicrobia bacterium]|nr:AAA family ATPase [Elusimicrobiota bacterium]